MIALTIILVLLSPIIILVAVKFAIVPGYKEVVIRTRYRKTLSQIEHAHKVAARMWDHKDD
jgi:hypothetical protein